MTICEINFVIFDLQALAGKARSCNFLPSHISKTRAIFIVVLDLVNIGFILLGAFFTPGVSTYLLMIFIGNLFVYLVYYCVMKVVKKEKFLPTAYVIAILSIGEISQSIKV